MTPPRLLVAFLAATTALLASHPGLPPPDVRAFAAADVPGGLAPGAVVPNFRLTDHRGVTRELYYESTAKAVVLVFTAGGGPRTLQTASALRALRARFSPSDVVIWQIDSNAGANRAAIAAEQTLFNNDTPVLIDDAQIVATELGVTRQLEAFVIGPPPFAPLIYRGPLDNANPASFESPTSHYASDAVAALLASRAPAQPRIEMAATSPALELLPAPSINYTTDIAPLVIRRCVSCHSTGNIAPHVYAKHDDLASRATQIRADMLIKRMAPWHADAQFGVFTNNVALTPIESATLHAWARAGAPRGTGADPLVSTAAPAGGDWPLGPPDLIVTIPTQTLPATGTIEYRYLTVPVPVTSERWLRAAVVKPGNARVVHHALVFDGNLLDVLLAEGGLGGFFTGYVPGLQQTFFPDGTGKRVRPNSEVTFQMHYTATGQPETDASQIGFYFANGTPERELQTKAASTASITIPAGAKEYEREATFLPSATRDVMLYELNPHMHYRGKRFKFEAIYPGGATEVLLNVPQYDFAWQSGYRLAQPKRLPAGTTIRVSGAFDNSAQNPSNPDPRSTVRFGEQTNDEMFIGYVNYAELPARAAAAPPAFAQNFASHTRIGEPFTFATRAASALATYRATGLPAGLQLDATSGSLSGTATAAGRHAIVITAENASGLAATMLDLSISPRGAPVFTVQPRSVRARIGETVTLTAAVSASPTPTYTWFVRGGEFCNTETPVLTLTDVTAAHAGDWVCVATNSAGTARSAVASLSLEFSGLVNLSARANVGTGANVVIPGITVRGDKPKSLLIRAVGPALAAPPFNLGGTLANPTLNVFTAAGEKILLNDNWGDMPDPVALRTATAGQGAFPLPDGSRDAAMLVTLPPGSYTVQVAGSGTGAAAQGVAIVEVYEADANPSSLVNLSCRAQVGTGGDILIAGFTISGTESKRILVRGVGPTLGSLGVSGALADPRLDVIRQGATIPLASNDDWDSTHASAFSSVGAFALTSGSKDAAVVLTLAPGSYTAQISGTGGTTGVALVEVYELP
jgi:peroxiredoxin